MSAVEVRHLRAGELEAAIGVLARGMRDNPGHVAAFGEDPDRRLDALHRMFSALLTVVQTQQRLCAVRDGVIVGVAVISPLGGCRPSGLRKLRIAGRLAGLGPRTIGRVVSWQNSWARRDPDAPHRHFGPIAVDAHAQSRGVGSLLLREYVRGLDADRLRGYLETDKPDNVVFYGKHGFEVTGEATVLGRPNWFMHRPPREPC